MIDDPEGYESGDCYCRLCVRRRSRVSPTRCATFGDGARRCCSSAPTSGFTRTFKDRSRARESPFRQEAPVYHPGVCSAPLKDAREKMTRATSLANLAVHTLDPVGMETAGNSPLGGALDAMRERQDDLKLLADITGGRTVMSTNAPEALLPAVFAESQSYYLLAFAPADRAANGKYHKIDVKVNRPGIERSNALGLLRGRNARGREQAERRHSRNRLGARGSPAAHGHSARRGRCAVRDARQTGVHGRCRAATHVSRFLPIVRKARSRSSSSRRRSIGTDDPSIQRHQTVSIALPSNASGDVPYEVLSRLTLKPGRYEIRVALDASPTQRASVYTYVDVPDFAEQPLSLSGVVLAASPAPPSAPVNAFKDLLPIVPTARREFARTDRCVGIRPRVPAVEGCASAGRRDGANPRHGGPRPDEGCCSLEPAQFASNHAADYRIALPVERLEPWRVSAEPRGRAWRVSPLAAVCGLPVR